jgi:hypothetical protein
VLARCTPTTLSCRLLQARRREEKQKEKEKDEEKKNKRRRRRMRISSIVRTFFFGIRGRRMHKIGSNLYFCMPPT